MKKKILIPIVGQGSIAHLIRTGILQRIRFFCDPVVILLWQQDDLIAELRADGIEVHIMPEYKVGGSYKNVRSTINYWYQYFRLKTTSTNIQKNYSLALKPIGYVLKQNIKESILWLKLRLIPGYIQRLKLEENTMLQKERVYSTYSQWVDTLNADGIFTVTPFLQEVELVARLLKTKNALLISSVHSFDNVTKRGWPAIFFDHYFVWNKYNKAELERINPDFKKTSLIDIAGAPQFDFHYQESFCWSKAEWLQKLKLPEGKKIILYAGGASSLLPNEPQYVKHLIAGLEKRGMKDDVIVLFRCHPLDNVKRWKDYIGESPFIYYDYKPTVDRKLDYNNLTIDDLRRLVSTLKYTDVHISVCSTMTVDGSIFNKPQIAPYYDDVNKPSENKLRAIYRQEHYLPIINSGVLNFAHSQPSFINKVTSALVNPDKYSVNCQKCVEEIITYKDGKSTERVVARLKTLICA